MTYYKWLTPEMTSDRGCRNSWRVGVVHRAHDGGLEAADSGRPGLCLLKHPVDALHFGHWPGRLFEAEPVGPFASEDPETVHCLGVRLIRELDAAMVFGPNGFRVVDLLSRLKRFSWLRGEGELSAAMDAAAEHQARLAPWGWYPIPVGSCPFDGWGAVPEIACGAVRPAAQTGSWTAWAATGYPWKMWAAPWAAWAAWSAAWTGVEAGAGAAAWAAARDTWKGPGPWPDPSNSAWLEATRALRAAMKALAAFAADHAAMAAEYLVCSGGLPPDPFEPLIEIWEMGYWPVGVIDGRYIVGDLSPLCRS